MTRASGSPNACQFCRSSVAASGDGRRRCSSCGRQPSELLLRTFVDPWRGAARAEGQPEGEHVSTRHPVEQHVLAEAIAALDKPLTPPEKRALDHVIAASRREEQPTLSSIARELGFQNASYALNLLRRLESKGWLFRLPGGEVVLLREQ